MAATDGDTTPSFKTFSYSIQSKFFGIYVSLTIYLALARIS